jgi:hypothetical protein
MRYYDTERGRFIGRDPIGFAGGINQYSYVANNPTLFLDPLGNTVIQPPIVAAIKLGLDIGDVLWADITGPVDEAAWDNMDPGTRLQLLSRVYNKWSTIAHHSSHLPFYRLGASYMLKFLDPSNNGKQQFEWRYIEENATQSARIRAEIQRMMDLLESDADYANSTMPGKDHVVIKWKRIPDALWSVNDTNQRLYYALRGFTMGSFHVAKFTYKDCQLYRAKGVHTYRLYDWYDFHNNSKSLHVFGDIAFNDVEGFLMQRFKMAKRFQIRGAARYRSSKIEYPPLRISWDQGFAPDLFATDSIAGMAFPALD